MSEALKEALRRVGWKYDRKTRHWTYEVGDQRFIADSLRAALRMHRTIELAALEARKAARG